MTEQEELAIEVLTEQLERARFETIDLGNIREKKAVEKQSYPKNTLHRTGV